MGRSIPPVNRPAVGWIPARPLGWIVAFGGIYVLLHALTLLVIPNLEVVAGQISLVYLPTFVRVVSVVVAGLAGAAGIALGSLFINLFYYDMTVEAASAISMASGCGIWMAYWILRQAMQVPMAPIRLPLLIALTGLYCTFNAILHGVVWAVFDMTGGISLRELTLMMVGDFLGVVVMFAVVRVCLRAFGRLRSEARPGDVSGGRT